MTGVATKTGFALSAGFSSAFGASAFGASGFGASGFGACSTGATGFASSAFGASAFAWTTGSCSAWSATALTETHACGFSTLSAISKIIAISCFKMSSMREKSISDLRA